jgi:hypothetical protein
MVVLGRIRKRLMLRSNKEMRQPMGIPKPLPKERVPAELHKILLPEGQPLSTPRIWNMGVNIIPRMGLWN